MTSNFLSTAENLDDLDEVGNVLWHLLHLCKIILLNVLHSLHIAIVASHEVDTHTLAPVSTGPANAMQIIFYILWEIVVDH